MMPNKQKALKSKKKIYLLPCQKAMNLETKSSVMTAVERGKERNRECYMPGSICYKFSSVVYMVF